MHTHYIFTSHTENNIQNQQECAYNIIQYVNRIDRANKCNIRERMDHRLLANCMIP